MSLKCEIRQRELPEATVDKNPDVVFGYEDPSKNLFRNWDFESDIRATDWVLPKGSWERCPDAHTGQWSLKLNSKHFQTLAMQRVRGLKKNTDYYYSFFLKVVSELRCDELFDVKITVVMKMRDSSTTMDKVTHLKFLTAPGHQKAIWQQIGGNFQTPNEDLEYAETQLTIVPHNVVFLLDTASLMELPVDAHWRRTADQQISKYRMSNVNLCVKLPHGDNPRDYVVRINQTKRKFGIGSAIHAHKFNLGNELGRNYRKCFFEHFEWAVFCNDTKWKPMEKSKGNINFGRVDEAVDKLHAKGVTVRGHAIHWNNEGNNPGWVQEKHGEEFQAELMRRVDYVVEHFKGKFVQWDVCNEHLHKRYLEKQGGNYCQLKDFFHRAHAIDPDCQLYLNDYLIFRSGWRTSGQYNLARELLAEGVPVHGIGVQSHLRRLPVDYNVLKKRAEVVSAAGLPVMITELSFHSDDPRVRAENLERVMRLYFSIPQIVGIIFWGFSDQPGLTMVSEDMALFEGPDFQPNEAGLALQKLLKEWRTDKTFCSPLHKYAETFRAFHGHYQLEVLRRGVRVGGSQPVVFTVDENQDVDIQLFVEGEATCGIEQRVS